MRPCQPGLYPLRVAGGKGISNPVVIGVDRLPQVAFAEPLAELPVALHGAVGGGAGPAGQAGRQEGPAAGARCRGPAARARASSRSCGCTTRGARRSPGARRGRSLGGDARFETVLPADAEYTIELHDQLFRPAGPGFFRLKIGDLQYADLALPLAVAAGSKQPLRVRLVEHRRAARSTMPRA